MSDPWQFCKIVEADPISGSLTLLNDNLAWLRKYLSTDFKVNDTPITLISVLGSPSSGKSFYTNLFAEYLNTNGMGWISSIKDKGLQGFAFGCKTSPGTFVPDKEKSGIYFWPRLFPREDGNGAKLVWIMHVHHKNEENGRHSLTLAGRNSLNALLGIASSAVVDIVWREQKASLLTLSENVKQPVKNQLCQHVVHLVRKIPSEPSIDTSNFPDAEKVFPISHMDKISEDDGKISLSMRSSAALGKLFTKVTDATELHPRKHGQDNVTMETIEDFLNHCINLVNSNQDDTSNRTSSKVKPNTVQARKDAKEPKENISAKKETQNICEDASSHVDDAKIPEKSLKNNDNPSIPSSTDFNEPSTCTPVDPLENKIGLVRRKKTQGPEEAHPKENESEKTSTSSRGTNPEDAANVGKLLNSDLVEPALLGMLSAWIEAHLNRGNIEKVESVFDTSVNEIIQNIKQSNKFSNVAAPELWTAARRDVKCRFKNYFVFVQKGLANFCSRTDAQFKNTPYFPPNDLRQNLQLTMNKIVAGIDEQAVAELVRKGCIKMVPYYEALNERKIQFEKCISTECIHQIRNFYKEEMQRVSEAEKYYDPRILKKIHDSLVKNLENVYEISLNSVEDVSSQKSNLKRNLDNDFVDFDRKNLGKIEASQKGVSSLIARLKSEYEIKLDTLLEDHPEGVPQLTFDNEQDKVEREVVNQFKIEVVKLVLDKESTEQHVATLKLYIDKSRGFFEEQNITNLGETEKKTQKSTKPNMPSPRAQAPERTPTVPTCSLSPPSDSRENLLPPLLFHLALNRIGIGTIRDWCIDNITYTTSEIAVTNENEWIYGDAVRQKLSTFGSGILQKSWHLGQCFPTRSPGSGGSLWTDEICHDGKLQKITAEFILGMLLNTIKREKEQEHEPGRISTVLIGVPFWFPSFQRQQVLDAAKIAGFQQAHLFNENSSSAYFAYSSQMHEANYDTIVISENSQRVDISLYSYDQGIRKLAMLGHSGDYESNRMGWLEYGYSILEKFVKSIGPGRQQGEAEAAIKDIVILWKRTLAQAEKQHYSWMSPKRKVLICCETESCVSVLENAAKQILNEREFIDRIHQAPLHGLAAILQSLQNNLLTPESIIRDGMPFYVNVYLPSGEQRNVVKKYDTFTRYSLRYPKCTFPAAIGIVQISQDNSSGKFIIGQIKINRMQPNYNGIEVTLYRLPGGLIYLHQLEWTSTSFSYLVTRRKVDEADCEWIPYNLVPNQIAFYSDLLQQVQAFAGSAGKVLTAKKMVKDKGDEIINAINCGKGNFKNAIVKTLLVKQVGDAVRFTNQKDLTEDDLKEKIHFLDNILSNYNLQ